MENREILIANTKTQTKSKITTNATTLGELKAALDAANIDYSDMTFTEGISKTQLLDNSTPLPQNLMFKGKVTNNLVILLTNTKKKISSGIYAGDRTACYRVIKEQNLQEDVKKHFGRNFTQVPTVALQDFIEKRTEIPSNDIDDDNEDNDREEDIDMKEDNESISKDKVDKITKAILTFINTLRYADIIGDEEVKTITNALSTTCDIVREREKNNTETISTSDGSIDESDIDNMLNNLNL